MGTTVVAGLFFDDKLTIAHVGDSRMYRLRDGKLEQVTQDHSLLQELVDRGFYTPEEAQRAAAKNYVTRALGVEPTVDVEITEVPVAEGRPVPALLRRPVGHGRGRRHSVNDQHLWC